ncbi:hypothetical protein [Hyalangium versicolor]|uniref:hypothetical protein n=1 Tax=Hyalangium versicolor TaxID=2861190 RepID=UPI001CCBCC06|nr:hypothetical protein [Hyalangium versicolor]
MSATVLQLHHRETFERNVTRALAAGAGAGLLHLAIHKAGLALPLAYMVLAGTLLAVARGDKWDRLLLSGLGVLLPALPYALGMAPAWTAGLSAAAAGALLVRAHLNERGEESQVGERRPTFINYVLGAGLCAGLTLGGVAVARILAARMADLATPVLLGAGVTGAIVGLFVGLSSVAAHLALASDPVEARCEELLPQLSGDFHTLAQRALTIYRQCGQSLAQLPREPAREEMARTLSRMTKDAVELASEWAGVETQLEERAQTELQTEREELLRAAKASTDMVARRQLESAAASLGEEVERLGELKQRRERILARIRAQVAQLDRARVALLSLRSGHAQMKAAELSALSRRFRALSSSQIEEGQAMDAVAAQATLAQTEPAPSVPAPTTASPEAMAPVAPIAEDAEVPSAPVQERVS